MTPATTDDDPALARLRKVVGGRYPGHDLRGLSREAAFLRMRDISRDPDAMAILDRAFAVVQGDRPEDAAGLEAMDFLMYLYRLHGIAHPGTPPTRRSRTRKPGFARLARTPRT